MSVSLSPPAFAGREVARDLRAGGWTMSRSERAESSPRQGYGETLEAPEVAGADGGQTSAAAAITPIALATPR